MSGGESFASITVPEGVPGALDDAAGEFGTIAGSLAGAAGELRGMPGTMSSWSGPASVSYAGACVTNSTACDAAVDVLGEAERAARVYAAKLKAAQERTRHAIEDARDAQRRIDKTEQEIAAAQRRRAAATSAAAFAARQSSIALAAGVPDPGAEAMRSQAESDALAAADDEARARRELEQARDDLERAQRRGHEAMDDARGAARDAAAAFGAAAGASPVYAMAGPAAAPGSGGGSPSFWNTKNEGWQWWDEDQFLSQLVFFHPKQDEIGRYKWWGDQILNAGLDYASMAAVAYGGRLRDRAIQDVASYTARYMRTFVAGAGGTVLKETLVISRGTTTVIDAGLLAKAGTWSRAGKAIPYVGGAVAVGSAGWDQWREDAKNPNLTTTDRVGRAAGVGAYVGGAAVGGAMIGSMLFPGVGTVAGLAIGAGVGLVAGAVASSIEPLKDAAAAAGQWTANAAVDAWDWGGDRIADIGSAIDAGKEWLSDNLPKPSLTALPVPDVDLPDVDLPDVDLPDVDLPDVDLPDLNPF
jgi:hypothetical protein